MKTVLVSIPNAMIYRNIAMFEGSVLDRLSRTPNIHIVVLTHTDLVFDYVGKRESITVEFVAKDFSKTLLQRLCTFFHSYLIFTDTTKALSGYGIRADKPRSIFRLWNYPIKLFLARIVGKSAWVRNCVAPWAYKKTYAKRRPYEALFKKYAFDVAFCSSVCAWPADMEIIREAEAHGVPIVGMPGNWDHLSKYFIPFKPNKLLVWADEVAREAVAYQLYDCNSVRVVGAPQIDFFLRPEVLEKREEFLQRIGFPSGCRVVTYASAGPYALDGADYVDMLLKWIASGTLSNDVHVIVRPHPSGIYEKEKYEHFAKDSRVFIDTTEGWSSVDRARHFISVMAHSDVLISMYSTIATEAALFDTPVVIASFDGYTTRPYHQSVRRTARMTHFQDIVATNGVIVAESPNDLHHGVAQYLENPALHRMEREEIKTLAFGPCDGKSSERITATVLQALL